MKKGIIILTFAVCMLLLIGGRAQADTLTLGGSYTSPINMIENGNDEAYGGGSIDPSSLNGKALPWVYCVDLFDVVYVPGTYNQTVVSNSGVINGSPLLNAGEVAWLLQTYAIPGQNGNTQVALQAAIWTLIYPAGEVQLNTGAESSAIDSLYSTMLTQAATHTGNISNFFWLSPGNGSGTIYQGLVAPRPVPIPPTAYLIVSGLIPFIRLRKKR